jgi:hypothetical protein
LSKNKSKKPRLNHCGLIKNSFSLAARYGSQRGFQLTLSEKQIHSALKELESEKSQLTEALHQGGITAIAANDIFIAAYKGTTTTAWRTPK